MFCSSQSHLCIVTRRDIPLEHMPESSFLARVRSCQCFIPVSHTFDFPGNRKLHLHLRIFRSIG